MDTEWTHSHNKNNNGFIDYFLVVIEKISKMGAKRFFNNKNQAV